MTLIERLDILRQLRSQLIKRPASLQKAILKAVLQNGWFTAEGIDQALQAIVDHFLDDKKLNQWLATYNVPEATTPIKKVGLIMAGNIPLVGFHDWLCTFAAGHIAHIKLSSKDEALMKALTLMLYEIDPRMVDYLKIQEKLQDYEAVIATGSNNTFRYFEHYFSRSPNLLRKNRNSLAILTGKESPETIHELGKDIFTYYGLGCRNVSKIMVPEGYDFTFLLDHLQSYQTVSNHTKYHNNYEYHYSILLLDQTPHLISTHLILTENKAIASPVAILHYEYYTDEDDLNNKLIEQKDQIQCVVGDPTSQGKCIPFGQTQSPTLTDYADGMDTMAFLRALG